MAKLFRDQEGEHTLLLAAHRCVCDERSVETLARELSAAYGLHGPPADGLPDAASALRPARDPANDERGARFFAQTLADAPPLHGFPLLGPRPRDARGHSRDVLP